MMNKISRVALSFICLVVSLFCLFSLSSCKDKNGDIKHKPEYNDARQVCVNDIIESGECVYSIQKLESNLENQENDKFYFLVVRYPLYVGGTPKTYLYIVSYTKSEKRNYEVSLEKRLL